MEVTRFTERKSPARKLRGYSLIEVLVALVVLSIGMLGIAALFLTTLKDTQHAFNRSKAVAFAWDMVERIRSNRDAGASYAAVWTDTGTDGSCNANSGNSSPATCADATLAAHDIFEWKTAIADTEKGLPGGTGQIVINSATTPDTYTISVQWTEGVAQNGTPDTQTVTVVTQL